ncbi:MAG: hypothetical protein QMD80_00320 [archaeon]|nr:hypothetical protein [archaeon]
MGYASHAPWREPATSTGLLPADLAGEEELLEVTDLRLSEDGTKLVLEAVLHSPLNVPVTIKEMQAEFILDGILYTYPER